MDQLTTSQQNGSWTYLIVLGIFFVAMYFLTIRPQNKKDKELKNLRDNLKIGDEIMTIGGFYGTVVRIKDDRITIASGADQTKLEITKTAVSTVLNREIPVSKKAAAPVEEESDKASPKTIKKLSKKSETNTEAEEAKKEE